MYEKENVKIKEPKFNYVDIEIKRIVKDKNNHITEITEKKKVPDFIAEILKGEDLFS